MIKSLRRIHPKNTEKHTQKFNAINAVEIQSLAWNATVYVTLGGLVPHWGKLSLCKSFG